MTFIDLNPRLKEKILVFDCPCGKCGGLIRIPIGPERTVGPENPNGDWKMTGELQNATLEPSVNVGCWHGNITNGEVSTCA